MMNFLVGPIANMVTDAVKGFVETKKAKAEAENARIAIRNIRRDSLASMKALEKDGELTEDDISDSEKDIQEITDDFSKQIDSTLESKEKDLLTI